MSSNSINQVFVKKFGDDFSCCIDALNQIQTMKKNQILQEIHQQIFCRIYYEPTETEKTLRDVDAFQSVASLFAKVILKAAKQMDYLTLREPYLLTMESI